MIRRPLAIAVLTLAAIGLGGAPAAHAARAGVSPGDEIRAVGATSVARCTLGYTYTDPVNGTAGLGRR